MMHSLFVYGLYVGAEKMENEGVKVAKVNVEAETSLAEQFKVEGFPHIIWFQDGKQTEVDVDRSMPALMSFIMKKVGGLVVSGLCHGHLVGAVCGPWLWGSGGCCQKLM